MILLILWNFSLFFFLGASYVSTALDLCFVNAVCYWVNRGLVIFGDHGGNILGDDHAFADLVDRS